MNIDIPEDVIQDLVDNHGFSREEALIECLVLIDENLEEEEI